MLDLEGFDVEVDSNSVEIFQGSTSTASLLSESASSFPVFEESLSYEQLAEELTTFFVSSLNGKPISKNTLKNNWLNADGRIARIYKDLQTPPLKTDSGRVTPFGIKAVFEFALLVHMGSKPYDDYLLEVQSRYKTNAQSSNSVRTLLPDLAEGSPEVANKPNVSVETKTSIVVAAPELPKKYSLAAFQPVDAIEIDDPLTLAKQIVQAVNQVQSAMQQDIERKEKKLSETRKAKDIVTAKVQELKLDQRFYQEKATQLSTAQTQDTQTLQELAVLLQGLGKPAPTNSVAASS